MVVHMAMTGLDVLDRGDTLLLGFMRQHGSESHVTDTLDVCNSRVELVIDDDTTFGIELNTNLLEVETLGVWTTADSDENNVCFQLFEEHVSQTCKET